MATINTPQNYIGSHPPHNSYKNIKDTQKILHSKWIRMGDNILDNHKDLVRKNIQQVNWINDDGSTKLVYVIERSKIQPGKKM